MRSELEASSDEVISADLEASLPRSGSKLKLPVLSSAFLGFGQKIECRPSMVRVRTGRYPGVQTPVLAPGLVRLNVFAVYSKRSLCVCVCAMC